MEYTSNTKAKTYNSNNQTQHQGKTESNIHCLATVRNQKIEDQITESILKKASKIHW